MPTCRDDTASNPYQHSRELHLRPRHTRPGDNHWWRWCRRPCGCWCRCGGGCGLTRGHTRTPTTRSSVGCARYDGDRCHCAVFMSRGSGRVGHAHERNGGHHPGHIQCWQNVHAGRRLCFETAKRSGTRVERITKVGHNSPHGQIIFRCRSLSSHYFFPTTQNSK